MKKLQSSLSSATRSLLRYPGSKARLARFIYESIFLNDGRCSTFIEPFCGGASVSIALLESNTVEEIIINDIDPLVASLWKCVFSKKNAEWLADSIKQITLSLDQWQIQKNLRPANTREAALKCLFLNRTSFSGLLHRNAGPIGGRAQAKWKLGCRFNREKLASRIIELSKLSPRVRSVTQQPWQVVCNKWAGNKDVFFYLDPPFYHKAHRLYRVVFSDIEHQELRDYLLTLKSPWILSYDNAAEIRDLYDNFNINTRIIDNTYSAHPVGGNSFVGRELLYSNLKELPKPSKDKSNHVGLSVRKFENHRVSTSTLMRIPVSSL